MVVCKYFQLGSCRFGQYCRYEHINNYATNANRNKALDGKNIALVVAEDVLAAERGGQWLLSCFGPFKEQPSIPGMEDLSPEEVRWEMYQAEKKGTVDQIKVQFQQLCQDMKTKRDALKNPTPEMITMLENLQKNGQETVFGASSVTKPSNFSFVTPQLGATTASSTSNVFGKSFGTSGNPFGGSFSSSGGNSLFGGTTTTNSGSVFGSKPTFGNNSVFGSASSTTSLFGGASKVPTPSFGAQKTQSFGTLTSQNSSVFGGSMTTQPVFGQTTAFGNNQNSSFLRPGSTQTSTVFGNNATSTFGGAPPTFSSPSVFGNSGGSSSFGPTSTPAENSSVFGQPKSTTVFGVAPVFGGTSSFGATQPDSAFGGQPNYSRNSTTGTTIFGSTQNATNFGSSATSAISIFGVGTQAAPFGSITTSFGQTTAVSTPFGQTTTAVSSSFGQTTTAAGTPFGQTATAAGTPFGQTVIVPTPFTTTSGPFRTTTTAPFSQSVPFGQTITGTDSSSNFEGSTSSVAPLNSGFGVLNTAPPPFGVQINFGNASSPFAKTNSTTTTSPFMTTLQVTNSSFENPGQIQNTFAGSECAPFAKSVFDGFSAVATIDNSIFTSEGLLTDDEKSWYLEERFILGKIPLKAPTKELR